MSVQEIIKAVEALPTDQRREFYAQLEVKRRNDPEAQPSAHDRAKHLIGSIDGPPDLSTNKAYLSDLGKRSLS